MNDFALDARDEDLGDELDALAAAMCDGVASAADRDRLEVLLEDEGAQRRYLDYMRLHAGLRRRMGRRLPTPAFAAASPQPQIPPSPPLAPSRHPITHRPWPFSLTIASLVMGLLLVTMAVTTPSFYRALTQRDDSGETPLEKRVARVARIHNAVNVGDRQRGAELTAGQRVRFEQGLVEIIHFNGTKVILEAPCDYQVDAANAGTLHDGKLVATVPPIAAGFSVATAWGAVTDLGTEFGVQADEEEMQVVVFQGLVDVALKAPADKPIPAETQRLQAGESLRLTYRGFESPASDAAPRFQRRMPAEIVASPSPVTDGLAVHLDAENINGGDNAGMVAGQPVRTWANLAPRAASIGNFQGSAALALDALRGRPAVRFNGSSDVLTNPSAVGNRPESELTIFAVARPDESNPRPAGLVGVRNRNGNGWTLRYNDNTELLFGAAGTPATTTLAAPQGFNLIIATRPAVGQGDATLHLGDGSEARVAASGYFVAHAPTRVGQDTFDGGRHLLKGEIAELLIFDRLLTPAETGAVTEYLSKKYFTPTP